MVMRYQKRISGPLLDRIDIHVQVPRVPYEKLTGERMGESSSVVARECKPRGSGSTRASRRTTPLPTPLYPTPAWCATPT